MKYKILVALVLSCLLVLPVFADHFEDFQTYSAPGWVCYTNGLGTCPMGIGIGEDINATVAGAGGVPTSNYTLFYWDTEYATNYYAHVTPRILGTGYWYFMDNNKSLLWSVATGGAAANTIWEFIRDPTTGLMSAYYNNIFTGTASYLAVPPRYLAFKVPNLAPGAQQIWIDNFHAGSADPKYWTTAIPQNWSVVRDFMNPANSGLYANTTLIRTTYMYTRWSRGNGTSIGTISLKNVATGVSYETLGIGTSTTFTGILRNNLSVLTSPTSTAPLGLYELTQDAGSGPYNHGYFMLIGSGAGVTWDQDTYTLDEVATITYTVTPGYWDTATYWYFIRVLDQNLATKYSTPITASSGSLPLTLDSSYDDGDVFYATVYAVKKSDSSEIMMNYDYMEMDYDTIIAGTCHNATSGATLTGANVTTTQGTIVSFDLSDPAYRIEGLTTGVPTVLNATMYGYTNFTFTFTPLLAKTYDINISMVPDNLSYYPNASIGGVVYSTPYHQPIFDASVRIVNDTKNEVTNTTFTGWYAFTDLLPNGTYWVQASKYGYSLGSNTSVIAQVS